MGAGADAEEHRLIRANQIWSADIKWIFYFVETDRWRVVVSTRWVVLLYMGSGLCLLGKHWASRWSNTKKTQILSDYTYPNEAGGFRKTLALLSSLFVKLIYPSLYFPSFVFGSCFLRGFWAQCFDNGVVRERLEIPIISKNFASYLFSKLIVDTVGQNLIGSILIQHNDYNKHSSNIYFHLLRLKGLWALTFPPYVRNMIWQILPFTNIRSSQTRRQFFF